MTEYNQGFLMGLFIGLMALPLHYTRVMLAGFLFAAFMLRQYGAI